MTENAESSKDRTQLEGLGGPDALSSRWRHWSVSVRAAEPGALVADVPPENLLRVLGDARDAEGPGFRRLVDLTAVDHGVEATGARFDLIYWLSRPEGGDSLRVRVALGTSSGGALGLFPGLQPESPLGASSESPREAAPEVDSIVSLWPSANWLEREVFDLFGIAFRGHPNLRRLLLPADFEGAPLRKDYPRQPNLPLPKPLEATYSPETPETGER